MAHTEASMVTYRQNCQSDANTNITTSEFTHDAYIHPVKHTLSQISMLYQCRAQTAKYRLAAREFVTPIQLPIYQLPSS